jgi:hypothetical protein
MGLVLFEFNPADPHLMAAAFAALSLDRFDAPSKGERFLMDRI